MFFPFPHASIAYNVIRWVNEWNAEQSGSIPTLLLYQLSRKEKRLGDFYAHLSIFAHFKNL
jgi:hypothetical protein